MFKDIKIQFMVDLDEPKKIEGSALTQFYFLI